MKENLAGQRYGRLTVLDDVIEFNNNQGRPERKWLCRCDCGTEKYIRERSFRYGNTISCGCIRKELAQERAIQNRSNKTLAGQRYGRLTVLDNVIEFNNNQGRPERKWLCRCDCGTEKYIREQSLRYGLTKSCGCYRNERVAEKATHDLMGKTFGELTVLEKMTERGPGCTVRWRCLCSCGKEHIVMGTHLSSGLVTHCPDRKAHRIRRDSQIKDITGQKFGRLTALHLTDKRKNNSAVWHCCCDCGNEVDVPYRQLITGTKSCGCLKTEIILEQQRMLTFVDGTSLNRIKNQKIPTHNTTGYVGVFRFRGKYGAKIHFQRKQYYLGFFSSIEEAAEARKKAEELLFDGTAAYYERWKKRADEDPKWAEENPISIQVNRDCNGKLTVTYDPLL